MFWRHRKVMRDREAGMVFDWRRNHGSTRRLLIAALVSATFWGVLLAYVEIGVEEEETASDAQIDLTLVNLDLKQNIWLAELLDSETLFHRRWDVSETEVQELAIAQAVQKNSLRIYEPTLREISMPQTTPTLASLPGYEAGVLPDPELVELTTFASPPVNWWVKVAVVDGPNGGIEVEPYQFEWTGPLDQMSEGETWTVLMGVDWQGEIVVSETSDQAKGPKAEMILKKLRETKFPALEKKAPLRWWRLESCVVNRPFIE